MDTTSKFTEESEKMRTVLGDEEYGKISEVLLSHQEQFKQQVAETHALAQRQWTFTSRFFFPVLARYSSSSTSGGPPTHAPPMPPQQLAAEQAMSKWYASHAAQAQVSAPSKPGASPGAPAAEAGGVHWWQDPTAAFGTPAPVMVHAARAGQSVSTSQQMESTQIDSTGPSAGRSLQDHGFAGYSGRPFTSPSGDGAARRSALGDAAGGKLAGSGDVSDSRKRTHGSAFEEPGPSSAGEDGKVGSMPVHKHHHYHHHHYGGARGYGDHQVVGGASAQAGGAAGAASAEGGKRAPAVPAPKKATAQSAADILLALSDVTAPGQDQHTNYGHGSGNQAALLKEKAAEKSPVAQDAPKQTAAS